MSFLSDLSARRGMITIGGNPTSFVELTGGEPVEYSFYEPDPTTARYEYYYNTRLNTLYKKRCVADPVSRETACFWQEVTEC